jgi:ribosomal protein S18 acetylase RimI-like enzyme
MQSIWLKIIYEVLGNNKIFTSFVSSNGANGVFLNPLIRQTWNDDQTYQFKELFTVWRILNPKIYQFGGVNMSFSLKIEQLESIEEHIDELSKLLIRVVEEGASIGFLPPLDSIDSVKYWNTVLAPDVVLLVAQINNQVVGSVQLHLSTKQNGQFRAEIAKLITHPNYRRQGIGRSLMQNAEERAIQEGRSLLILDTREGDPSNSLYASMGYIQAGRIPNYAQSANGELHATIFYYKELIKPRH